MFQIAPKGSVVRAASVVVESVRYQGRKISRQGSE